VRGYCSRRRRHPHPCRARVGDYRNALTQSDVLRFVPAMHIRCPAPARLGKRFWNRVVKIGSSSPTDPRCASLAFRCFMSPQRLLLGYANYREKFVS
jgi:hypothetical protein